MEKRRRGLARYLNALVRHPVLCQEQLVVMFLTVPTVSVHFCPLGPLPLDAADNRQELAVWRKQATISVQEEFDGRSLPPTLEDSLPPSLEELFARSYLGIRRSAELYMTICSVMDRLVKRTEGVAADHGRIAMSLASLTETSADTYATDTNEVPLLNDGLVALSKHLRTGQGLLEDESRAWDAGVLEDLKRQRDGLVSVRDMFERRDRLDRDNIAQLERRIEANEGKLGQLRTREGVKPGEIEKVAESIIKVRFPSYSSHPPSYSRTTGGRFRLTKNTRTRRASCGSTTAPSLSRSASATSCATSRARSTTCRGGARTGRRSASSTPRCWRTTGGG